VAYSPLISPASKVAVHVTSPAPSVAMTQASDPAAEPFVPQRTSPVGEIATPRARSAFAPASPPPARRETRGFSAHCQCAGRPADVQEATLEIPNLVGLQNGLTPLNWVIDLKFAPADPSTIIPVIEYQPTATPVSATSVSTTQTPETYGAILVLDKSASLPDGYILYGTITWTDPIIPQYGLSATLAGIKDANGNDIPLRIMALEGLPVESADPMPPR